MFFAFSLIIEGTTEKVLQFMMPFKSVDCRNLCFIEQKMYFEHYGEFQSRKTLLIDITVATKISIDLLRAASYMLMLILRKDALFHFRMFVIS
jgi:hypothetical protein